LRPSRRRDADEQVRLRDAALDVIAFRESVLAMIDGIIGGFAFRHVAASN
jgi:hypothetical protein